MVYILDSRSALGLVTCLKTELDYLHVDNEQTSILHGANEDRISLFFPRLIKLHIQMLLSPLPLVLVKL